MANFVYYVSAFLVLLVAVIAAYGDFKSGKICNKLIFFGLVSGISLLLISVLAGVLPFAFFWQSLLNAFIALLLGYVLWYFDLWAAGDAKLFFVLSLLLPLRFYWRGFLPIFPSLAILINAFVPLLIFIFCQSIFFIGKKIFLFFRQKNLKRRFKGISGEFRQWLKTNYLKYLASLAGFFSAFVIFQLVRLRTDKFLGRFSEGKWALFFLTAFLGTVFGRIAKNKKILFVLSGVLAVFALGYFFYRRNLLFDLILINKNSILRIAGFGLLFLLFSSYEKANQNRNLHFAFWLFLGVFLTILFQGSLLRLIF